MLIGSASSLVALTQTRTTSAVPSAYHEGQITADLRHRRFARSPIEVAQRDALAAAPAVTLQPVVRFRFGPVGAISGRAALDKQQRIYVSSQDGHLYGLTAGGALRFKRTLGAAARGGPVWTPLGPCVGTDYGQLRCFDANGEPRLTVDLGDAIDDQPLRGRDGLLYISAGDRLWRVDGQRIAPPELLLQADNRLLASPVQDDMGHLFVAGHDRQLYALTPAGKLRWQQRTATTFDASPTLVAQDIVLAGEHGRLYRFATADGALRGQRKIDGHVRSAIQHIDNHLWLQTFGPRPALITLNPGDLRIVRQVHFPLCDTAEQGSRSAATPDGAGLLWTGGPDHAIYAFDNAGRLHHRAPVGGRVHAQPVVNRQGIVIVGAMDGYLYGLQGSRVAH